MAQNVCRVWAAYIIPVYPEFPAAIARSCIPAIRKKATPEGGSKMAQSSNTATGNVSSFRLFLVAVGTFCMMLCNGIINNSTTYFIKPVSEFLGGETTTFSLYFTIITICSAIMSLVVMPMVMRIGMRISAIIACIGVGAGFFMMSRVQALWMVYAGALLIGIFRAFDMKGNVEKW